MDNDNRRADDRADRVAAAPLGREVPPARDDRRGGWLPWLIGALLTVGLLVLLLRGCDHANDNRAVVDPGATTAATAGDRMGDAGDPITGTAAPATYSSADFDAYLSGSEPTGRAFALDRVTFASGSDTLDSQGRAELTELAGVLKRHPTAAIALTGYADPAGDAAANQALSRRRAEAVRAALAKAGASPSAVTLAAKGETGATAERANRKVEVQVTAR